MSQTATVASSLQPAGGSPFGVSVPVAYTALEPGLMLPLTGAQTYNVDLAMMPGTGLTGLVVSVDKTDAFGGAVTAPVKVVFTNGYLWIPPGGAMSVAAPALASGGITSLSLVTTANAVVHVSACG